MAHPDDTMHFGPRLTQANGWLPLCICGSGSGSSAPAPHAVIERFFAAAKRSSGLGTADCLGRRVVLLQVTLTSCAIVRPAPRRLGADLRLSPTRVLAHYLPVEQAL
jgi:hypothetical protein